MTPEQRQRVEIADWQKARFGDSDEARAALAYWRERGWHVDDRQKCPDERVYDFMSGWRAAHALTAAALEAAEQERDTARETAQKHQRRAQALESGVRDNLEACRRAGVSLGRRLAAAGYELERQRAEQAEAKLAALTAPPAPHAEAVRVLEEAWWRGRLSATARQGEWAGPELRERCGKDIADVLAALRAEGEGGDA